MKAFFALFILLTVAAAQNYDRSSWPSTQNQS